MDSSDEQENAPLPFSSQEAPPSSPLVPSSRTTKKPKAKSSVTPRRLSKFFRPRYAADTMSAAGRELRDLTRGKQNVKEASACLDDLPDIPPSKRRRTSPTTLAINRGPTPDSSPPMKVQIKDRPEFFIHIDDEPLYPKPIRRAKQRDVYPQAEHYTANLWSTPRETFQTRAPNGRPVLPFCIATCHTNSLFAVGDERGGVNILDSNPGAREGFSAYLSFDVHNNAVMDISFSSDDRFLCSGGGDQTARVTDMRTQKTILMLNEQDSSLRRVLFQPGNDNIIATSARDGTIRIWDTRCETRVPRRVISGDHDVWRDHDKALPQGKSFHTIMTSLTPSSSANNSRRTGGSSTPSRRTASSVTSMTFVNESQPNLLFTAADHTSKIFLWDLRFRQRSRASPASLSIPVSTSSPIPSHASHRDWGITSISLSSDSARLYAVCRDNIVYTYSTAHIALGASSSVFATKDQTPMHRARLTACEGALPLYAFTNPDLHASTFYSRAAVRRAVDDKPELFATGSGNPTPIVFPTDEKVLRTQPLLNAGSAHSAVTTPAGTPGPLTPAASSPAIPSRTSSRRVLQSAQALNPFPTYMTGTTLTGAHTSDVTFVDWTMGGELVSIADDCTVRMWRESPGAITGRAGEFFERNPAAALRSARRVHGEDEWGFGRADGPSMDDFDSSD